MAETSIEWTDRVWNPTNGCSLVSPGCTNCYAMRFAHRFSGPGGRYEGLTKLGGRGPVWTGVMRFSPEKLVEPLFWRKPARVFVNSMSDLFHAALRQEDVASVLAVMAATPRHTYQVLTKRPAVMADFFRWLGSDGDGYEQGSRAVLTRHLNAVVIASAGEAGIKKSTWQAELFKACLTGDSRGLADLQGEWGGEPWPLPNLWLGVSVENRIHGLPRIAELRRVPAAVRFLSIEPLLEDLGDLDLTGIHWVIVGGESGHGARPFSIHWARRIVAQCRAQGVRVFVKQLGARPTMAGPSMKNIVLATGQGRLHLADRKGGTQEEWPAELADLRVREFPLVARD